jgi:hypothetical protein
MRKISFDLVGILQESQHPRNSENRCKHSGQNSKAGGQRSEKAPVKKASRDFQGYSQSPNTHYRSKPLRLKTLYSLI